jgi:ABC-type Fe3+-citrate transport system substrate-binding protein
MTIILTVSLITTEISSSSDEEQAKNADTTSEEGTERLLIRNKAMVIFKYAEKQW